MKQFVGVGACYLDTILRYVPLGIRVPPPPYQRSLSNTCTSIPHFVAEDEKLRATEIVRRRGGNCPNTLEVLHQLLDCRGDIAMELNLLAVLPHREAPAVQEVAQSLGAGVSLETCLYRDGHEEPASSYIIKNLSNSSRTIINYNALPEMTFEEFVNVSGSVGPDGIWYHFEVRSPSFVACGAHLCSRSLTF